MIIVNSFHFHIIIIIPYTDLLDGTNEHQHIPNIEPSRTKFQ